MPLAQDGPMLRRALAILAVATVGEAANCFDQNYCNGHGTCNEIDSTCTCYDGYGSATDIALYKPPDCSARACSRVPRDPRAAPSLAHARARALPARLCARGAQGRARRAARGATCRRRSTGRTRPPSARTAASATAAAACASATPATWATRASGPRERARVVPRDRARPRARAPSARVLISSRLARSAAARTSARATGGACR